MSKTKVEPRHYEIWEVEASVNGLIRAAHAELAREEKQHNKRMYETFGEWKALNPNHPVAKKNYPHDEYVMVISAYKTYFDGLAAASLKEVTVLDY